MLNNIETLISIIIPIYNKEFYLEKCLNSLKGQTYKNIEVLMIDDGSVDCSKDICKKYEQDDKRFSYFYQKNSGVSIARNLGIEMSKGQWIMFVDPDDYVENSLVETLYNEIDEVTDIVGCCCMANYNGNLILNEFFESDYVFSNNKTDIVELIMELMDEQYKATSKRFTAIGVPWAKLYRKEMLVENNLKFDKELKRMQDNIFNMHAFDKSRKFIYINKPLYIYSCDNIASINKKYDPESIVYFNKIVKMRREYLVKNDLMQSPNIKQAFNMESYKLLEIMISKYFLNKNNKCYLSDKVKKIEFYIDKNGYDKILESITLKKVKSKKQAIKIIFLKRSIYLYAILFELKNNIICK